MSKQDASRKQPERTSSEVAHVAGQLLNGKNVSAAVEWLKDVADNPQSRADVREHAVALLGAVDSARRVAASALTQR